MLTFTALTTSSFRVTGGTTPVTVFPAKASTGGKDGITLLSVPEETDTPGAISWPGEYNVGGISVKGIGHNDGKQVSYVADIDGVRCAFLSSPVLDWTDKQIESVGDIAVLVLPATDGKLVQKLVDEFDPRVLIILPGTEKGALGSVEKVIGVKERASEYKLKGALPAEGREVVVLESPNM
ncbi:hypothetical protein EXS70_04055 [Candidatus Peribacteria bacterium]|nr:hypothetical protein [Candidatus Peribacteria bacterium]